MVPEEFANGEALTFSRQRLDCDHYVTTWLRLVKKC